MNGRERLEQQVLSGVRSRVIFLDALRTQHGFEDVVCLTPKVETRLRKGEQPQINLKVQYICSQVAINLSVDREYPCTPIEVELNDLEETGVDDNDSDESEDAGDNRDRKLIVIQEYLQRYCSSITLNDDSTAEGGAVGLDVIAKFKDLLEEHLKSKGGDIQLNALGEIQQSIFQFGSVNSALDNLAGDVDDSVHEVDVPSTDNGGVAIGASVQEPIYKCKKCRCVLFSRSHVQEHIEAKPTPGGCTSLFLKEELFMDGGGRDGNGTGLSLLDDTGGNETGNSGKLACTKCGNRVGGWSWIGLSCSCKEWVCPAFQAITSKVDMQ
jgi:hypothetical protein